MCKEDKRKIMCRILPLKNYIILTVWIKHCCKEHIEMSEEDMFENVLFFSPFLQKKFFFLMLHFFQLIMYSYLLRQCNDSIPKTNFSLLIKEELFRWTSHIPNWFKKRLCNMKNNSWLVGWFMWRVCQQTPITFL